MRPVWAITQMRFWIAVPLRVALTTLAAVSLPTVRALCQAVPSFAQQVRLNFLCA
jgi:hypothetical protein